MSAVREGRGKSVSRHGSPPAGGTSEDVMKEVSSGPGGGVSGGHSKERVKHPGDPACFCD